MLTHEQFLKHLRSALNHVYDHDYLRSSPLTKLFGVAGQFDTPSRLQNILIAAIEALEPQSGEKAQSSTWSNYETLFYRYVQRLSQQEVAEQLNICARHVRRKQHIALEVLAHQLWEQFELEREIVSTSAAGKSSSVSRELAWLQDAPLEAPADLDQALHSALDRVRPLAAQCETRLEIVKASALPGLAVHPVALGQILLALLGIAIHRTPRGEITISTRLLAQEVEIEMRGSPMQDAPYLPSPHPAAQDDVQSLDIVHQLTDLSYGKLTTSAGQDAFLATLTLPVVEELPVLVIDDNADTLQLLQRYAMETRYHLICTRDPQQAVDLAHKVCPDVIVLDVMMPEVDGWEIFARLKQHPHTSHIPIIVCTILAQQDIALSLGAQGFVRKPVSRQAFLTALDRQILPMEPESC